MIVFIPINGKFGNYLNINVKCYGIKKWWGLIETIKHYNLKIYELFSSMYPFI